MELEGDYVKGLRRSRSLPTILSFSSVNTPKGRFKPFRIYDAVDANVLLVNDRDNFWYQDGIPDVSRDTHEAAKRLVDQARSMGNGRAVTFGTSMGAAGAALFAALGSADGCLAFGLEPVLKRPHSRSLLHMPTNYRARWLDARDIISKAECPIYSYCSESDEVDLDGALLLRGVSNVVHMSIRGAAHPGIQVFDLDRSIGNVLTDFASKGRSPSGFPRQGWLFSRWGAVECLVAADRAKRNGDHSECLAILVEACRNYPGEPAIYTRLGSAYQANRNGRAAEEAWLLAVSLCSHQYEAHGKLTNVYRKKSALAKAYEHAKAALAINPRDAHLHHNYGLVLLAMEKVHDAQKSFLRATQIAPGNVEFRASLDAAQQAAA